MTTQHIGKYACLEVERRYLMNKIPAELLDNPQGWLITDHYLPNTRLRLRQMQSVTSKEKIYKLTQKYCSETQKPYETTITNLYLTEAEYNHLKVLEAKVLQKRRYSHRASSRTFSIDVFEGRHHGLILAEIELENQSEADQVVLPPFALEDVTADPFFTGGNLVAMTEQEFQQGLSQRLRDYENCQAKTSPTMEHTGANQ